MKRLFKLVLLVALGFGWALPAQAQNECGLNAVPVRGTNGNDSSGVNHQNECIDLRTGLMFFPGLQSIINSGALTSQSISGELQVGSLGPVQFPSVAACYAALLPGQGCAIPNNWNDPNWTQGLVINKNHTYLRYLGDATMNMQAQTLTVPSSVSGFKIITPGMSEATSAGIRWLYTGNSSAFTIGDGITSTSGIDFGPFTVNLVNAGTSATGLTLIQVFNSDFRGVQVFGSNAGSQVGWLLTDGGGTVGTIDNRFVALRVTNTKFGWRFVPTSTGGVSNNHFDVAVFGTSVPASIGFDLQAASTGNQIANADLNGIATAINFAAVATVNNNRFPSIFLQNNTTDVSAGAGSHDNFADPVGNVTPTITDSGTNNSFRGLTTQIKVGSGSIALPSINIGGSSGFFNSAGATVWTDGTFARHSFGSGVGNEIGLRSNGGILWVASGDPNSGTKDTGVSRPAAGVVSVDTTTVGNSLGTIKPGLYASGTNCAVNSASPAACGAAPTGVFAVPTTTTTYTVNTTAVTANSRIFIQDITDNTGIPSAPTCTALAAFGDGQVSARVAGTSFTIALPSTAGTTCFNYWVMN